MSQIAKLIKTTPAKSCPLNPTPSWLKKIDHTHRVIIVIVLASDFNHFDTEFLDIDLGLT